LVSSDIYYKKVRGITVQSQGFVNQYIFKKGVGSYAVTGTDLLINKRSKNFSTWLSYSFANNNYTFETTKEVHFPNNLDIRHKLSFGYSYSNKQFKASAGLNWHSGKPTTIPVTGNEVVANAVNFEPANASNIKDYFRVDISATYTFKIRNKTKGVLGVPLWNILNKKNELNRYYRLDATNLPVKYQQNSLSLTPNLTLRIHF